MKIRNFFGLILVLATLLLVLAPVFSTEAAMFKAGDEYALRSDELISEDLYVGAGAATIGGNVLGDLVIGGGATTLTGNVSQDVYAVGGSIQILGDVSDDVRGAGGQVVIGGTIGGDLVFAGGFIHILPTATINGDVIVAGGAIVLEGSVLGDFTIRGGDVSIRGEVHGDSDIRVSESLKVHDGAVLAGNLDYTSKEEAEISDGATIIGAVTFSEKVSPLGKIFAVNKYILISIKGLLILAAALFLALFFKRASLSVVEEGISNTGRSFLRGLIVLIVMPITAVLLFVSIIGFIPGILVLLSYFVMLILAQVFAGITLGALLSKLFKKEVSTGWNFVVLGVVILSLLSLIPVVGWVAVLFLFLISLGGITYTAKKSLESLR